MLDPRKIGGEETDAGSSGSGGHEAPRDIDHDDRLIRWMLGLTPVRRLEALQNFVDGVAALQHAKKIAQ